MQDDAADGYILVPHLTPHGIDRFVDEVVPLLQERGVFRADYEGPTLRDHLGLPGRRRPQRGALGRRSTALVDAHATTGRPDRVELAIVGAGPDGLVAARASRRQRCPSCSPDARCGCTSSIPTAPGPGGCGDPTSTRCCG